LSCAGYEILSKVEFPWPVAETVRQHHEKANSTGYPQGLRSNEILLEAKILILADVVKAMSSHRPWELWKNSDISVNADILHGNRVVKEFIDLVEENPSLLESQQEDRGD